MTVTVSSNVRLILFPARERILRSCRRSQPAIFAPFLNPLNNHLATEPCERAWKQEARARDGKTIRWWRRMSRRWLAVGAVYKFAVVVRQKRATALRKKKRWRENEMEQEGGSEAKSGCWLRKNKTNRLLTPPPPFPSHSILPGTELRYGNSLNWSAERATPGSSL